MSVTVEFKASGRIARMIYGKLAWRKWKAYANEKRANEAVKTLNRNHAWMGTRFRVAPVSEEGG